MTPSTVIAVELISRAIGLAPLPIDHVEVGRPRGPVLGRLPTSTDDAVAVFQAADEPLVEAGGVAPHGPRVIGQAHPVDPEDPAGVRVELDELAGRVVGADDGRDRHWGVVA